MRQRESLLGAALICSVIANTHRDPKRRSKPYTPDDFLPKTGRGDSGAEEQTPEQMLRAAMRLAGLAELPRHADESPAPIPEDGAAR